MTALFSYNPLLWECKDGDIAFNLLLNPTAVKANLALMEGIKRDGIDIRFLKSWEWDKKGWRDMSLEQAKEVVQILAKFFRMHTKAELLQMAVQNRFQIGPCNDAEDVLKHPQLAARNFWKDIEHPELGTSLKYPGGAVKPRRGYCGIRRRAPLIGEHNAEIYQKELEMSARQNQHSERTPGYLESGGLNRGKETFGRGKSNPALLGRGRGLYSELSQPLRSYDHQSGNIHLSGPGQGF